jgi:hypothetical protein
MITGTGKENEETFIEFDDGGRLIIANNMQETMIEGGKTQIIQDAIDSTSPEEIYELVTKFKSNIPAEHLENIHSEELPFDVLHDAAMSIQDDIRELRGKMGRDNTGKSTEILTFANEILEPYLEYEALYIYKRQSNQQNAAELQQCRSGKDITSRALKPLPPTEQEDYQRMVVNNPPLKTTNSGGWVGRTDPRNNAMRHSIREKAKYKNRGS